MVVRLDKNKKIVNPVINTSAVKTLLQTTLSKTDRPVRGFQNSAAFLERL
jgi:hypothetical protein